MNFNVKIFLPALVAFVMFFLLCQFRSVPVSQFWKGYRMLYVYSEQLSENEILAVLEKNGCSSIVSSSVQKLPVSSQIAPVQAQDSRSYLFRRSEFFTDKNHRAMVFYVPDSQASAMERGMRELAAFQGTALGTDGKASFPWIAPIITLLLFALFIAFSKNRILYLLGSFFFILLAFCRPLFTVGAASMLYLFAFFLFHRFWARAYFLKTAMNSPYVLLFSLSPLLVLLLSSPLLSVFYLLAFIGSASVLYLYFLFQQWVESRCSFKPVFIRSARMIPVFGRLGIRLLAALFASLVAILLCFKLSGSVASISASAAMPSLPAPVSRDSGELVNFSDFISWTWNTVTFPYKKITENTGSVPREGERVSIKDYQEQDGRIVTVETQAYVYNSDFRDSVYKLVENLDYPALEKMMLRQGKNSGYAYTKKASVSTSERFASLLIIVFCTLTAAIGIYYIIGRKRYGLSI